MGQQQSSSASAYKFSDNDYELVIKASKELEHLLETEFGATGRGLHEKIAAALNFLRMSFDKCGFRPQFGTD